MLSFKDNIGMWKIVLNQITDADFVIGYGFDNNEKLNNWANYRLKGGVEALPEGLQIK